MGDSAVPEERLGGRAGPDIGGRNTAFTQLYKPSPRRNGGDTQVRHTYIQAVANSWCQTFFIQRKLP